MPKQNASYKCLSLIIADFVVRVNKKYYPQTVLKEFKYEIKKTEMETFINGDLDLISSDDESDNESDIWSDSESND